jgi:hypothetical protein
MSVLALLLLVASTSQHTPPPPDPLARIAVIGASASAGWGVVVDDGPSDEPLPIHHRHVDLAEVLPVVLTGASPAMSRHADISFFANPRKVGRVEMDHALATKPTLIVAVDYLFWYGYGDRPDAARMNMLERGLQELERFDGPILVGDIPDVADAADVQPLALLSKRQVPRPETLLAMNKRIHEWAGEYPNVHHIPLAETIGSWRKGTPPNLNGYAWPPECRIIQFDRLHPTAEGLVATAELVAESIRAHVSPVDVQADPAAVLADLRAPQQVVAP